MVRMVRIGLLCMICVSLFSSETARAQTVNDEGLWFAFITNGDIARRGSNFDRLKWRFEGHARFLDDAGGFNQGIIRPALGWQVNEQTSVFAGYDWIPNLPARGEEFIEHRSWQQLGWSRSFDPLTLALRSRLEQRFLDTGDDMGWRFRQLFRVQHDLPNSRHFTLVGWDEVFFHLNDTDFGARAGFDQNRVFVGLGLKGRPNSRWRTEIGYLNQFINLPGGNDRSHHILSINVYRSPK